ncbi:MAG: hypothetical protein U1E23_10475 [Reyranellaceae bacterium]
MDGMAILEPGTLSSGASAGGTADHVRPELPVDHPAIERIYVGAAAAAYRVLAVVGCDDGETHHVLARLLAERSARSGDSTLLVDLSLTLESESDRARWTPGDHRASEAVIADPRGFDRLSARACVRTAMRFRSLAALRQLFADDLSPYTTIIVDAGALMGGEGAVVPAATVAQACDGVVLTATPGALSQRRLEAELEALGPARSRVVGFALDDFALPTMGEELLAMGNRLQKKPLRPLAKLLNRIGRWPFLWERV